MSVRTPDAESTRTRPGPRVGNARGVKASALAWASVLSYELDLERRQYRV